MQYLAEQSKTPLASFLTQRVQEIRCSVAESVRGLSHWEAQLLTPIKEEELVLQRHVAARPRINFVASADCNPLPDYVTGKLEVPEWIQTGVFGMGARSAHGVVGLVPYFLIVQEPGEELNMDKIGFADVTQEGHYYQIPLVLSS